MQKLKHPNVLKVLEMHIDIEQGYIYYVMEYYKSTPLRSYGEPENKLHPGSIKKLFQELAEGLFYLHNNFVVHRDLSPSNILILKKTAFQDISSNTSARIIDFNVAKFFEPEDKVDANKKFK